MTALANTENSYKVVSNQLRALLDNAIIQTRQAQLFITGRDGGAPRRLAVGGAQNVDPDWGANGYIAYSSLIGGQFQVCVVNPATGETRQISRDDANYEDPAWAPDGRHIFCVRRQGYHSRIFIIDTLSSSCISLLAETEKGDWYSPDCSGKYKNAK